MYPRRADDKRLEKAVEVLQEQGKGGATEGETSQQDVNPCCGMSITYRLNNNTEGYEANRSVRPLLFGLQQPEFTCRLGNST